MRPRHCRARRANPLVAVQRIGKTATLPRLLWARQKLYAHTKRPVTRYTQAPGTFKNCDRTTAQISREVQNLSRRGRPWLSLARPVGAAAYVVYRRPPMAVDNPFDPHPPQMFLLPLRCASTTEGAVDWRAPAVALPPPLASPCRARCRRPASHWPRRVRVRMHGRYRLRAEWRAPGNLA